MAYPPPLTTPSWSLSQVGSSLLWACQLLEGLLGSQFRTPEGVLLSQVQPWQGARPEDRPPGEAHRTLPLHSALRAEDQVKGHLKGAGVSAKAAGGAREAGRRGGGGDRSRLRCAGARGSRAAAGGRPSRFPLLPALLDPREGVGTAAGRTKRCRPPRAEPGGCVFSAVSNRSPPRQEARRWE